MQLDLFSDNRRTIRLNQAEDALRALDPERALAIYRDLLQDEPQDRTLLQLLRMAGKWRDSLSLFHRSPVGCDRLHRLWSELAGDTPALLAAGVSELLLAELRELLEPELIYVPPQFHIGALLMKKKRYDQAEHWFSLALKSGIEQRARFLGWRGDALTMMGDAYRAKESYLAAFLENPRAVDLAGCRNKTILELLSALEIENSEEIEPEDLAGWLPAWGWLRGVFSLSLIEVAADSEAFAASLEKSEAAREMEPPRLWFHYLRYAEHLRAASPKTAEMVRVRRKLKEMSGFMFDRYLERVRGL